MRLMVAGGAGFLGSHLVKRLLTSGHYVIVVDNFYTGKPENLKDLRTNGNLEVIRHDIVKPFQIEVDGIFNFACPASPIHYQRDPVRTMITNVQGSINLLNLARSTGAKILQASTSEVYGDPEVHPQPESYLGKVNTTGIRACYDEGKRAAETLFFDYARQYQVDIRIARIFNTFGPNMSIDDGRVVTNFIHQALTNQPISIFGDGNQTRSFCYVDDLIEGIVRLFESSYSLSPVNLGNPKPISMLTLANEILELCESKSQIEFLPLPQDDPRDREPDISMAREILGWEPSISRVIGLEKTISYIKEIL